MFRKFRVVNKGLPDIKKLLISLWKPVFHDAGDEFWVGFRLGVEF